LRGEIGAGGRIFAFGTLEFVDRQRHRRAKPGAAWVHLNITGTPGPVLTVVIGSGT
jgi:hypothetical protein